MAPLRRGLMDPTIAFMGGRTPRTDQELREAYVAYRKRIGKPKASGREIVLHAFLTFDRPVTVGEVLEKGRDACYNLGYSTALRALVFFADAGIATMSPGTTAFVFEVLRTEPRSEWEILADVRAVSERLRREAATEGKGPSR